MAIPKRGFGLTGGIGQEVTWGTAVARTNWLRLISSSMASKLQRAMIGHQGSHGQASTNFRYSLVERNESGGSVSWVASYNDSTQMLMRHAFGTVADAGAGPYTHEFTLASPPPVGFTWENIGGTHATLDQARVFEGCKISRFEMAVEAGRPMICTADIIAEDAGDWAAAGSPTYTTSPEYVLHNHLTTAITINSVTYDARRLVLTINRNLQRNYQLGSLLTAEPYEERLEVDLEIEVLKNTNTWTTLHEGSTAYDTTWTFDGGTPDMAFTLHNAVVWDVDEPVGEPGATRQTVRLKGFADGTDQGLKCIVTNSNALYSAN
jgi:hypothetical protein